MPRRCALATFVDPTDDDPRFARVSDSGKITWLKLVSAAATIGDGQRIEIDHLFGSVDRFAVWFRIEGTKLKSAIQELVDAVLLTVEDGIWTLADRVGGYSFKRAVAVKINGKQGGRPARQAAPEPDRRQHTMPLVRKIEGGRTDRAETGTVRASTSYSLAKLKLSSTTAHASARDCIEVGNKLAEIVGCDIPHNRFSIGLVKGWLKEGATTELILATAREVAARENRPDSIHIGYLTGPILDAVHMARIGHLPRVSDYSEEARARWQADIKAWRDNGCVGRGPDLADYAQAAAA